MANGITGGAGRGSRDDERQRALRLFEYLRAFSRLRLRHECDINEWEEVIWFADLTDPANCRTRLDDPDMDEFVHVERIRAPDAPTLPPALKPWIEPAQVANWSDPPGLPEEAYSNVEGSNARPNVLDAWDDYQDRWVRWAALREEIQPSLDVYRTLFRTHQRASQLGEQYEVVIGTGLLSWQLPRITIRRHLITAPAPIIHDADTGLIGVATPEIGDIRLRIEDEMVPGEYRPQTSYREIRAALEAADDPLGAEVMEALRRWAHEASASGAFHNDLRPSGAPTCDPRIDFAPAVILRRRRARSLDETFGDILGEIQEGCDIPATVRDLAADTSDARRRDDPERDGDGYHRPEPIPLTFFPLPANPQQHRIVEMLSRRRGVVVHGPPGTGKTHTIANLISHCLALGERVLVTSHTDRALRVLKEQLPRDIRDLTVSILGTGRTGAEDLRNSAEQILTRRGDPDWSVESLDETISRLKTDLDGAKDTREQLRADLARFQAAASESHQLPSGFAGPLGEIAMQLAEEREVDGWLPDHVSGPIPITHDEIAELCELRERVRDIDESLISMYLPAGDGLPSTERLQAVARHRGDAEQALHRLDGDLSIAERLLEFEVDLSHLEQLLQSHGDAERAVRRRREEWLDAALTDSDAGATTTWEDLRRRTDVFLARDRGHEYDDVHVGAVSMADLPARASGLESQADSLIAFLAKGGNLHRRFPRPSSAVRRAQELLGFARDLGLRVDGPEAVSALRMLIAEFDGLIRLQQHWGDHLDVTRGTLAQVRARLSDALVTLDHLATLWAARTALARHVVAAITDPVDTAEDVTHLADACRIARAAREQEALRRDLDAVNCDNAPAIVPEMIDAARNMRIDEYQRLVAELDNLRDDQRNITRFATLRDALRTSAPNLTDDLLEGRTELPQADELAQAWRWSWAMSDIERYGRSDEAALASELHRIEEESRNITAELTCKIAWRKALASLSDYEVQELRAYQQALRRYGRGRGRLATTHQREAQRHLENCRTAIPAWIMPTYRVAETLAADPESFDVVIVDEASQSGIDAMFLFWLGKKLVIVGDDNQISPSTIGVLADDVLALQGTHLSGFGLRDLLGVDSSLFDQAVVRFAADEVWLTEHFRCMPEIIEFSNRLLYAPQNRRLEPLRQFGNDRLQPLVRRWVPGGEREGDTGRAVNRSEADELVSALLQCNADPSYDGLTFGVIGLLRGQADYIEARLLEQLPPEAWERRRLRCGDAYDFQGDERDVIFLSMVASLGEGRSRIPRLGHDRDKRQYNVAASRARNQMWLFHSMTLDQLAPDCPRFALLNHFVNPPEIDDAPFDEPIERDVRHHRFESLFEQRVFLDIRERGYATVPQYKVYGRRIDIVVVGSTRKLAVECDGAEWHGAEQYDQDLARQRDLERAGWTFFRIRDIDYYLDSQVALEPLWTLLQELDIHPRGMGTADDVREHPTDQSAPDRPTSATARQTGAETAVATAACTEPPSAARTEPPNSNEEPDRPEPIERAEASELEQYVAWDPSDRHMPSAATTAEPTLRSELLEIVVVEGPVVTERVYQLRNRASGLARLGGNIRSALDRAADVLAAQLSVVRTDPLGTDDSLQMTLRLPNQPEARPRTLGPRGKLDHVPPEELAAVLQRPDFLRLPREQRYRSVLALYGFSRLTAGVEDRLRRCDQTAEPSTAGGDSLRSME